MAGERIELLEREVAHAERIAVAAVDGYVPTVADRLDDLSVPAVEILRELPGVVGVEIKVSAAAPVHRLIHLRDWH
ncbi:MAG: hypothetical protein L0Z62_23845, partial [Gemmataceae bacterium]|nr:hypothetical protein [Gemmataceae bacterium]